MALIRGPFVLNKSLPQPACAGDICEQLFDFTFNADYTANDVIEIGGLPPMTRPVDLKIVTQNIAATATLDVGLVSGQYGDLDAARTSGAEFINNGAKNTELAAALANLVQIGDDDTKTRGVGVKLSANETAGATKKIYVSLRYVAA